MGVRQREKSIRKCARAQHLSRLRQNAAPRGKKSGGKPPHSKLRAFVPGSEVTFLLGGELVETVAHRVEL
jgi:hypothetical protein